MDIQITEAEFQAGLSAAERAAVAGMPLPVALGYVRAERAATAKTAAKAQPFYPYPFHLDEPFGHRHA